MDQLVEAPKKKHKNTFTLLSIHVFKGELFPPG